MPIKPLRFALAASVLCVPVPLSEYGTEGMRAMSANEARDGQLGR